MPDLRPHPFSGGLELARWIAQAAPPNPATATTSGTNPLTRCYFRSLLVVVSERVVHPG